MAAGLRKGLAERGWREGADYELVFRYANGDAQLLPRLAAELVALGVDVIVAGSNVGGLAAKSATGTIPIVIVTTGDPSDAGITGSLARPGGNVTGVTTMGFELNAKRLELLKEFVPRARHWAFLSDPASGHGPALIESAQAAARALGVRLTVFKVDVGQGVAPVFERLAAARVDALIVPPSIFFIDQRRTIVALAARARLPAIYFDRRFVEAGGFLFYGASLAAMYRHAAGHVDRILRGAKPGELPFEQPTTFELVINLKAAKALGLAVPEALLLRADEVIE
jgi:putative ABC transport system substrate-binding protein